MHNADCRYHCMSHEEKYQKYYCKKGSMRLLTSKEEIMREIFENGPVMTGMSIYEDLFSYVDGVYEYVSGELMGGHAVKLIGWGTEEDIGFFWIAQNQWAEDWGMDGFFQIKEHQVGIDSLALACDPDLI